MTPHPRKTPPLAPAPEMGLDNLTTAARPPENHMDPMEDVEDMEVMEEMEDVEVDTKCNPLYNYLPNPQNIIQSIL